MNCFLKLESIVKPIVINLGYNLLGINYDTKEKIINIFIKKKNVEITSSDCEKVYSNIIYILNIENYIIKKKYSIQVSSKGLGNVLLYDNAEQYINKVLKIYLLYPINNNNIIFGKLVYLNINKKKLYIHNKKKIILLFFYQIDKIKII